MGRSRLYLIDANAFCYRAYYALKELATSSGQPTSAVFGFVNFLNKILKQDKPQYLGVCFDVSRDTFRQKKFAEYKIQRPPMPEALVSQIPIIKRILQAYGVKIYQKVGFEADDLIASLAKKAKLTDMDVMIISSDKDVLQLVDEHVVVFSPYKDEGTFYDSKKIEEHFGIKPNQMVDFISLLGDTADNIPPVKGIGQKTAARLIQEFQSIEGILDNLEDIKPQGLQTTIKESIEKISLNRSIIKLRDDIELEFDLDKLNLKEPDYSTLYNIFRQLEFKSLLRNLPYQDNLQESLANKAKSLSDFGDIKELILFYQNQNLTCFSGKKDYFIEIREQDLDSKIQDILRNPEIKKIGHNLKELKVELSKRRVTLQGLYFDTMIAAYLLNSSRAGFGISDLAWEYFKEAFDERRIKAEIACSLIFRLKSVLEKELNQKDLDSLFSNLEMPLVNVLADMEATGVALDLEFIKRLSLKTEKALVDLVERIYELSGTQFNINSPKQLRNVLFDKLKLPVFKKTKSGPSTDEEVLSKLIPQHPVAKTLLDYRKLAKLKSTYIDALPQLINPKTHRIHASFNQVGTQTGRLSSSNPNLQNLPIRGEIGRKIRKAIVTSGTGNYLLSSDYSQIELRILAHFSRDEKLIDAFSNNQDIHIATACLIYGLEQKDISEEMRETAKRINFGIIYGLSNFGLSRDLGVSLEEAGTFIDAYFVRYPKVGDYIQEQIQNAQKYGYVTTILGRRRYIPEINSKNSSIRQFAERQAVNTPIQGSAADLIKKAMIEIYCQIDKLGLQSKLILQIHDELVFEVPGRELEAIIKLVSQKMEGCISLRVPIKVVIKKGKNWLEMEPVGK